MNEAVPMSDEKLLVELEPTATRLLEHHLSVAKEWFPHEMVPWSRGKEFEPDEEFNPEDANLTLGTRSALLANILTEDNLPHYFARISGKFGNEGSFGEWSRRWTAEEGRHSIVIRDYLTVTRSIDLRELERNRMIQVSGGIVPNPKSVPDGIVYVKMQELATRNAHRNTGRAIDDAAGKKIMSRVASDENLHHDFYDGLAEAGFVIDPDRFVIATLDQVINFAMPGTGIPNFDSLSEAIEDEHIFGAHELVKGVFLPSLDKWRPAIEKARLGSDASYARDELFKKQRQMTKILKRAEENGTRIVVPKIKVSA